MIVVIQRVANAQVSINNQIKSAISQGLLILLGIAHDDDFEDVNWLTRKIADLRIFEDEDAKMNHSLKDINGDLLLISQFTLYAQTKKGNRPSFINAAPPSIAIPLYEKFISQMGVELGKPISTGEFGANMKVTLLNDGPVTIIIDSKNKI